MPARYRYNILVLTIFRNHYRTGISEFEFDRAEIKSIARDLEITLSRDLDDMLSFPCWRGLPDEILDTEPAGYEWSIKTVGESTYRFRLFETGRILPRPDCVAIELADSTPAIISKWAVNHENAVLAKLRCNRLIDIFFGTVTYSLHGYMRTTVGGTGPVEIDELYVGVGRNGEQFVIPIQANGSADWRESIRTRQDAAYCAETFPDLICRPVSVRSVAHDVVALLELTLEGGTARIVEERHYNLVNRGPGRTRVSKPHSLR